MSRKRGRYPSSSLTLVRPRKRRTVKLRAPGRISARQVPGMVLYTNPRTRVTKRNVSTRVKVERLERKVNVANKRSLIHQQPPIQLTGSTDWVENYIEMGIGLRDWSAIATVADPNIGSLAGLPSTAALDANLLYITPQTKRGVDDDAKRIGNSILWKKSVIRFSMELPQGVGSAGSPWSPYKVRCVVFRFNGKKGLPCALAAPPVNYVENMPTQRDLWEQAHRMVETGTAVTDFMFANSCASLTRRYTDLPSPVKIVKQKDFYLPVTLSERRKQIKYTMVLDHTAKGGVGKRVNYENVDVGENPRFNEQSPLNHHYFMAFYVQAPMRINDFNANNTRLQRMPDYTVVSTIKPLAPWITLHVTHEFDA